MPSFIVNEWSPLGAGAYMQRVGDLLRVRVEWGVDASYSNVVSTDTLPGGPWRLTGFHVVSDDYMELHFKHELPTPVIDLTGVSSNEDFNAALMAGVPSKRELLAASLYGAVVGDEANDGRYAENAQIALKAADALIAEAAKR